MNELARADLWRIATLPMGAAMAAGVLAGAGLVLGLRRVVGLDGPAFSSVFQGVIRPNTYVGLAAASALYGAEGLPLTAVGIAVVVPPVNQPGVLAMVRHGRDGGGKRTGTGAVLALIG